MARTLGKSVIFTVALLAGTAVLGQGVPVAGAGVAAPEPLPPAESPAVQPTQPAFDPKPFLAAMVQYRRTAITCAPALGSDPVEDSRSIDEYLIALGQTPPNLVIPGLKYTLSQFIRAQGASICQDKLRSAYAQYSVRARDYTARKPEVWPAAPIVSAGPWCSSIACNELR